MWQKSLFLVPYLCQNLIQVMWATSGSPCPFCCFSQFLFPIFVPHLQNSNKTQGENIFNRVSLISEEAFDCIDQPLAMTSCMCRASIRALIITACSSVWPFSDVLVWKKKILTMLAPLKRKLSSSTSLNRKRKWRYVGDMKCNLA